MNMALNMKDVKSFDTLNALLAEATGVLVLVLVGAGTIAVSSALGGGALTSTGLVAVALSLGLTYMAMVAMTSRVSGGHINPAVTFSAVITGRMGVAKGVLYVAFQLAGGIAGALILMAVLTDAAQGTLGAVAVNDATVTNLVSALVIELILSFVLVYVMMVFIVGPGESNASPVAPVIVGLVVVVGTFLGFALTGAGMNPARVLGPALAGNVWADHWIYWIGPLAGAVMAAFVYEGFYVGRLRPGRKESE
ncbi:MAG: MIP/aquaporin family protein [Dehalococcoidia bacterium]